jgi:hypothetical protein
MLINSIICADCQEVMAVYELYDFYCDKSKLVLQMEERVCLQCSGSILQIVNVLPTCQNLEIGRSESLEISLISERVERNLSEEQISKLIKLYFWEKLKTLCLNKTNRVWYDKFEIELWEALLGLSSNIELAKEEILALKSISESLNIWGINPSNWTGLEKQASPFISIKAWKALYANRKKLFKTSFSHEQQSST